MRSAPEEGANLTLFRQHVLPPCSPCFATRASSEIVAGRRHIIVRHAIGGSSWRSRSFVHGRLFLCVMVSPCPPKCPAVAAVASKRHGDHGVGRLRREAIQPRCPNPRPFLQPMGL